MKIICIGRNYVDHAKEMNSKVPSSPLIFIKPETALNKSGKMKYPDFTSELHYELELVLEIKETAKNIPIENASQYINRIGLGIDFTARDIQAKCKEKGHPWEKAKAFDNSAALGKLIDISEIDNMKDLKFQLLKGDKVLQNGKSKDMIFSPDHIISYSSQYFTLCKGDLIYTGTPSGVGPVNIGDHFKGILNDKMLLEVSII